MKKDLKTSMEKSVIQKYLAAHPEKKHRKFIPQIVEELTGVEPEKQIAVKVAIRRLQEAIPNDLYGATKDREWREERGQVSVSEMAQEAVLGAKVINLNGMKYIVKSN